MKTTMLAAAAVLLATGAASARTELLTGTFVRDNDKARIVFLAGADPVTLTTLGYAGGATALGTVARGGFDPILSLYGADGLLVADNDDGDDVPLDSETARGGDAKLTLTLTPGYYALYVTQYNNFGPIDLVNGFAFDGQPDFRDGFVDFYGSQRTGAYAVLIEGVAAVPAPASLALFGLGAAALGRLRRRAR